MLEVKVTIADSQACSSKQKQAQAGMSKQLHHHTQTDYRQDVTKNKKDLLIHTEST